jgi:predicted nucleic acid-binding protein
MKFWDASALVPLLVEEDSSSRLRALSARDRVMVVWWASEVECVSALMRLRRIEAQDEQAVAVGMARLSKLAAEWHEVDPTGIVREAASRFLRVHPLRAADALQLAAAFIVSDRRPSSLELVTLDDRLKLAAQKEGFVVCDV